MVGGQVKLSGHFHAPAAFDLERQNQGTHFEGQIWRFWEGENFIPLPNQTTIPAPASLKTEAFNIKCQSFAQCGPYPRFTCD